MKVEWKEHDLQHASNIAEAEERAKTIKRKDGP